MYFWSIGRLKENLQRGRLSERDGLRYVLATFVAFTVILELNSRGGLSYTGAEDVASIASLIIFIFGTFLTYAANGGDRGTDFLGRYLALGWVLGIRVFLGTMAALVVAMLAMEASSPGSVDSPERMGELSAALTVLASGICYWRLAVHIRQVAFASTSARPTAIDAAS